MLLKKQLFILSISILLLPPFSVSAAGLVPCGSPTDGPGNEYCTVKHVFIIIARVTNTLIGLAGVYAVWEIVSGAFWLVPSMGKEEVITKRRKHIINAVVGFAMVMFAYIFVNTAVNYLLLEASKPKTSSDVDCRLNLADPLNYLYIHADPDKHKVCRK